MLTVVGVASCIFSTMHTYQKLVHVERDAQRASGSGCGALSV